MVSFARKREILDYAGNPDNWENRFNYNGMRTRAWDSYSIGDITIRFKSDKPSEEQSSKPKPSQLVILDTRTGAFLEAKKNGEEWHIRDESGHTLIYKSDAESSHVEGAGKVTKAKSANDIARPGYRVVPVDCMSAFIAFDNVGGKRILWDHSGTMVTLPQPDKITPDTGDHPTRFFHTVAFNLAAWDEGDASFWSLLNDVKLVLAHDLGLQTDLHASNEIDPVKLIGFVQSQLGDNALSIMPGQHIEHVEAKAEAVMALLSTGLKEIDPKKLRAFMKKHHGAPHMEDADADDPEFVHDVARAVIAMMQKEQGTEGEVTFTSVMSELMNSGRKGKTGLDLRKPWNDTSEFEGFDVATPRKFFVEKTDEGFDVSACSDHKHGICAQSAILQDADGKRNSRPVIFNPGTHVGEGLLSTLRRGTKFRDHQGHHWHYRLMASQQAAAVTAGIRRALTDNFSISGGDFMAIHHQSGLMVIGMRDEALAEARYDSHAKPRI